MKQFHKLKHIIKLWIESKNLGMKMVCWKCYEGDSCQGKRQEYGVTD